MAFVSVTRLRLRSIRFVIPFALETRRANAQVRAAAGFLGGGLLADRHWTFWTLTVWRDEAAMRAYMTVGAHRAAMPKLFGWCDEASVVHWSGTGDAVPEWEVAVARMQADGRASRVRHPSADQRDGRIPTPRLTRSVALRPIG